MVEFSLTVGTNLNHADDPRVLRCWMTLAVCRRGASETRFLGILGEKWIEKAQKTGFSDKLLGFEKKRSDAVLSSPRTIIMRRQGTLKRDLT